MVCLPQRIGPYAMEPGFATLALPAKAAARRPNRKTRLAIAAAQRAQRKAQAKHRA